MILDDKKIDDLAHLARLEFSDQEKVKVKNDLNKILEFCNQLKAVNTDGVEPLIYMSHEQNVLREDLVQEHLPKEKAFVNAPANDSDYFKVPKVINK